MKTVTVRDLRQRWPQTEKALEAEGEMVVTRDAKPVARLVRYVEPTERRKRFDAVRHGQWQRKVGGSQVTQWVDKGLSKERDER